MYSQIPGTRLPVRYIMVLTDYCQQAHRCGSDMWYSMLSYLPSCRDDSSLHHSFEAWALCILLPFKMI